MDTLSLKELVDWARRLAPIVEGKGRIQWKPNARLVRYYTNKGLMDRPLEKKGRSAFYGKRHLLQLLAIKKLQLGGASLEEVAAQLEGMGELQLVETAGFAKDWDQDFSAPPLNEDHDRPSALHERSTNMLLTIQSPKGGSGATTLAVNLAIGCAKPNRSVILVDLDLLFGDVAIQMNLAPTKTIADLCQSGKSLTAKSVRDFVVHHESSGLDVLLAPMRPDHAEVVTGAKILKTIRLLKDQYDLVVVDVPGPAAGWRLELLDESDSIVLPVCLDLSRIKNAKILLHQIIDARLGDRVSVVLSKAENERAGLTLGDVEAGLRCPVIPIPLDDEHIPDSCNKGDPWLLERSGQASSYGKAVLKLCRTLMCVR